MPLSQTLGATPPPSPFLRSDSCPGSPESTDVRCQGSPRFPDLYRRQRWLVPRDPRTSGGYRFPLRNGFTGSPPASGSVPGQVGARPLRREPLRHSPSLGDSGQTYDYEGLLFPRAVHPHTVVHGDSQVDTQDKHTRAVRHRSTLHTCTRDPHSLGGTGRGVEGCTPDVGSDRGVYG